MKSGSSALAGLGTAVNAGSDRVSKRLEFLKEKELDAENKRKRFMVGSQSTGFKQGEPRLG